MRDGYQFQDCLHDPEQLTHYGYGGYNQTSNCLNPKIDGLISNNYIYFLLVFGYRYFRAISIKTYHGWFCFLGSITGSSQWFPQSLNFQSTSAWISPGFATFCICWALINWPPMDLIEQVRLSWVWVDGGFTVPPSWWMFMALGKAMIHQRS